LVVMRCQPLRRALAYKKEIMASFKMSLLENSLSFFREALEQAIKAESNDEKWKFAVLIQIQAIETILKKRLSLEHKVFVYTDIDKCGHTVNLKQSIERLKKIAGVTLIESDHKTIEAAAELRNKIVHFDFEYSVEQVKSQFIRLVGFYIEFSNKHLDIHVVDSLSDNLKEELFKLRDYVAELKNRANTQIEAQDIPTNQIWTCPLCKQDTFVILNGQDRCYVCGHTEVISECEQCGQLEFEQDMHDYDFGNMKGWENIKQLCSECWDKLETECNEEFWG
ncbi:hypothetical protein, partial [Vibrio metoecus]|uniref:hypothetical protein n=2 Tax=Vibrio TaxID=662 RepID=UPI001F1B062E